MIRYLFFSSFFLISNLSSPAYGLRCICGQRLVLNPFASLRAVWLDTLLHLPQSQSGPVCLSGTLKLFKYYGVCVLPHCFMCADLVPWFVYFLTVRLWDVFTWMCPSQCQANWYWKSTCWLIQLEKVAAITKSGFVMNAIPLPVTLALDGTTVNTMKKYQNGNGKILSN